MHLWVCACACAQLNSRTLAGQKNTKHLIAQTANEHYVSNLPVANWQITLTGNRQNPGKKKKVVKVLGNGRKSSSKTTGVAGGRAENCSEGRKVNRVGED